MLCTFIFHQGMHDKFTRSEIVHDLIFVGMVAKPMPINFMTFYVTHYVLRSILIVHVFLICAYTLYFG